MAASRGFEFYEPFNPHGGKNLKCKCEFFAGVKGETKIEGYDPDECKRLWKIAKGAREYSGADQNQIKQLFESLSLESVDGIYLPEFKESWDRCQLACGSSDFIDAKNEALTRNDKWVLRGEIDPVDYSLMSGKQIRNQVSEAERRGYEALSDNGFTVKPIPEIKSAPANIDIFLNDELWELKTPCKTGGRLKSRLNEGIYKWERLHDAGQNLDSFPKIVVDNRDCAISDEDAIGIIKEVMETDYAKRQKLSEVILINKDSKLIRVKN